MIIEATVTETLTVQRTVRFEINNEATEGDIEDYVRQHAYSELAVSSDSPWEIVSSDGLTVKLHKNP